MTPKQRQIRIDLIGNVNRLRLNLSAIEKQDVFQMTPEQWFDLRTELVNMVDDIVIGIIEMK
jgi:hypothetical protein